MAAVLGHGDFSGRRRDPGRRSRGARRRLVQSSTAMSDHLGGHLTLCDLSRLGGSAALWHEPWLRTTSRRSRQPQLVLVPVPELCVIEFAKSSKRASRRSPRCPHKASATWRRRAMEWAPAPRRRGRRKLLAAMLLGACERALTLAVTGALATVYDPGTTNPRAALLRSRRRPLIPGRHERCRTQTRTKHWQHLASSRSIVSVVLAVPYAGPLRRSPPA